MQKRFTKGSLLITFLLTIAFKGFSQTDTEFWFVAPEITIGHGNDPGGEPVYFRVSALDLDAVVRIYQPANPAGLDTTFTVPSKSTISIDASPWIDDLENRPGNLVLNKGVHITSNNLITAYYDEDEYWNMDIFALKGRNALGTEFYTPFNNSWGNGTYTPLPYSSIDIVATENNTQVSITPTADIIGHGAGSTFTITLNKGETYSCLASSQSAAGHLGGTHITSNRPIAITLKDDSVKGGTQGCRDLIGDQTVPIVNAEGNPIVGFEYIVMRGKINLIDPSAVPVDPDGVPTGERIYIMATEPTTTVYIDGIALPTILNIPGEQIAYEISNNSTHVRGDKPIMVLHTAGFGCELGGAVLPTVDGCTGSVEVSFTRSTDQGFYLNLMTIDAAKHAFTMHYEDGSTFPIPISWFEPVGTTDYVCLKKADKFFLNKRDGGVPQLEVVKITNSVSVFHLGLIEGGRGTGCKYGYFSDYAAAEGDVKIVESGSRAAARCFGDTIQLRASGGISYSWSKTDYLDDPFIATPIATPPPGIHNYDVTIQRGCLGPITISVIVGIADEVEAFFETDKWYFCAPDTVTFDNQSFGVDMSRVENMQWDFDLQDPFNPYVNDLSPVMEHSYTNTTDSIMRKTIQLIVWNEQSCPSEFRRDIMIRPEITGGFNVDTSDGCHPVTVNFNNTSTGNTDRYKWELGDGNSANTPNVTHTYFNQGMADSTYQVEMVAISPFFCTDTVVADINVYPYIEAAFALDTFQGCSPLEISIDDNSAGYIEEYEWSFGDGDSSSLQGPTLYHTYHNPSIDPIYDTLQLVVRNDTRGCTDTVSRVVTVFPEVRSEFIADVLSACHETEIDFENLSTSTASIFAWDFGDGGSSSAEDPAHVFENMDTVNADYTVRLVSTSPYLCRDTSYQTIQIHPYINASFSVDEFQGCAPFQLVLHNVSEGGISGYEWDWGDSSPRSNLGDSIQTHPYENTGLDPVTNILKLVVQNADGCEDSLSRDITVFPEVNSVFTQDQTIGCNELPVTFTNQSVLPATSFLWEFGDGASSVQRDTLHLFKNTGYADSVYTTRLIAATPDGCTDTSEVDITVHTYVQADFTFSHATVCTPFDLTLYNSSVGGVSYHWDFGDSTELTVDNTDPVVHRFINPSPDEPVVYQITLTATNAAGCESVQTKDITILSSVQAGFLASIEEGCHPLSVDFTNTSIGAISYTWDFDNGWSSDEDSTSMTFENFGTNDTVFNVRLVANNLYACQDSFFVPILVHPLVDADFAIDYLDQCSPAQVIFNNSSVNGHEFSWVFNGDSLQTSSDAPIQRQFDNNSLDTTAIYPIDLTVTSAQGCTSSVSKEVTVYHLVRAGFSSILSGCHPLEVDFESVSPGALDYKWDFGDNTSSILQHPEHIFSNSGTSDTVYQVKLMAISENFCQDSAFSQITVFPGPKAKFDVDRTNGCSPLEVTIQNLSEAGDTYVWAFGDTTSPVVVTDMAPQTHTYFNQGDDVLYQDLRLGVATDRGCTDFITQTISVYPSVDVDFERDSAGCSPYFSQFRNTSQRSTNYTWIFDDGEYSYISEPGHTFVNPGQGNAIFNVELKGSSQYGCSDSMTRAVTVYPSPVARFDYTPIYQYFPSSSVSLVNETNEGSYEYEWNFGDSTYSIDRDPGSHTYAHWGEYNISLTASNEQCSDTVFHWIKIFPPMPIADFVPDRDSGCVPLTISLTNLSIYGEEYLWEFGDGTPSTDDFEPTHTYYEAGFYQIKLTVKGEGGEDIAFHEFEVYALPEVDFFIEPTLVMLPDEPVKTFNLTKYGSTYRWDFGDGTILNAMDTTHQYRAPGVYDVSLTAWSEHGCEASLLIPEAVTVIGEGTILFPNAFRPSLSGPTEGYYNDKENLNQIFHPVYEGVVDYKLEIYNRWGERLFHTEDINRGWDGYYDGVLCPQGVYVWQVWVVYANGKTETNAGDVTLLTNGE